MLQNSALIPNREFTFPIRYEGTVLVPSYLIGISLSLLGMKASRKSLFGAFIPNRDFTFPIRYEGTQNLGVAQRPGAGSIAPKDRDSCL